MEMQNERGQMLPRQGEMGENTSFTNNVDKRSVNDLGTDTDWRVTTVIQA